MSLNLHPMINVAVKAARAAGSIINRAALDVLMPVVHRADAELAICMLQRTTPQSFDVMVTIAATVVVPVCGHRRLKFSSEQFAAAKAMVEAAAVNVRVGLALPYPSPMIRVFVTGGTFDKTYDEIAGRLARNEKLRGFRDAQHWARRMGKGSRAMDAGPDPRGECIDLRHQAFALGLAATSARQRARWRKSSGM